MRKLLVLIFSTATLLVAAQTKDKYEQITDSLNELKQKDQLIKQFEDDLRSNPKSELTLRSAGRLYISGDNPGLGEKYYREALKINPNCANCYLNIGRAYTAKNNNEKALELLDSAIFIDPADAYIFYCRSKLKKFMGNDLGALLDISKAIKLDPKTEAYYIRRAELNYDSRYREAALSDLDKAIELKPGDYNAYYMRAKIYAQKLFINEALADVNKAIELNNAASMFYMSRGVIYNVMKEYERAIVDYSKAIELDPEDYDSYFKRGQSKYASYDMDGLCADMNKALVVLKKIAPDDSLRKNIETNIENFCNDERPVFYSQRGMAFYNLKLFKNAIDICTQGLKKFPGNVVTLSWRGNAYYDLNDYKHAVADFDLCEKNRKNLVEEIAINNPQKNNEEINGIADAWLLVILSKLAQSKFSLGQLNDALDEANKAIELIPAIHEIENESAYMVRGNIYLALNNFQKAKEDFDNCIQINESDPVAYASRAIAKVNLSGKSPLAVSMGGNSDDQSINIVWDEANTATPAVADLRSALTDCDKAIELGPDSGSTYYIRGIIKQMLKYSDFCSDLLKAKELGYDVAQEFLVGCKK